MIRVIVWKELRETIRDRNLLSSGLSVLLLLVLLNTTTLRHIAINMDSLVFYMTPCIGVMVAFSMSNRFVREKQEGIIETLLSTPLTLKELWLGKVIGLTIPSYTITLATVLALIYLKAHAMNEAMIVYLLLVIPVLIASTTGLLGLLQYTLGMKQIQALNYIVFLTLFTTLFITSRILATNNNITWEAIETVLALSAITLSITTYLISKLDKEKTITTID